MFCAPRPQYAIFAICTRPICRDWCCSCLILPCRCDLQSIPFETFYMNWPKIHYWHSPWGRLCPLLPVHSRKFRSGMVEGENGGCDLRRGWGLRDFLASECRRGDDVGLFWRFETLLQSLLLNLVQFDILSKDNAGTDQFAPWIAIGIHPPPPIDRVKVWNIDESVAILIFFPVKGFVSMKMIGGEREPSLSTSQKGRGWVMIAFVALRLLRKKKRARCSGRVDWCRRRCFMYLMLDVCPVNSERCEWGFFIPVVCLQIGWFGGVGRLSCLLLAVVVGSTIKISSEPKTFRGFLADFLVISPTKL